MRPFSIFLLFGSFLVFAQTAKADALKEAILAESHITEVDFAERAEVYGEGEERVVLIEDLDGFWFLFDSEGKQIVACAEEAANCNQRVRRARGIADPIPDDEAEAQG